jgi:Cof subfamily protein (haloacid dehalogenase superfamily)
MIYKALFLDVDGTLVPYEYDSLPSDAIVHAIDEAQKHVTVCLITGRSFGFVKPVLDRLNLTSGYAVVNTGSVIIDLATESVVHELPLNTSDVDVIFQVLTEEKINFYVKDTPLDRSHGLDLTEYRKSSVPEKTYMILTGEIYSEETMDSVLQKLSHLSQVNMHKTSHKEPNKYGLNITHINATKLHGVQFLLEKLNVERHEVIGVGDSYNDFPLLLASGLKVAMGNAIQELKDIADYIAPSVTEDGVADVIKKFILPKKE